MCWSLIHIRLSLEPSCINLLHSMCSWAWMWFTTTTTKNTQCMSVVYNNYTASHLGGSGCYFWDQIQIVMFFSKSCSPMFPKLRNNIIISLNLAGTYAGRGIWSDSRYSYAMYQPQCFGNESNIVDCRYNTTNTLGGCSSSYHDTSVICLPGMNIYHWGIMNLIM